MPVEGDPPAGGHLQTEHFHPYSGLTKAGFTHQDQDLAADYLETDSIYGMDDPLRSAFRVAGEVAVEWEVFVEIFDL